MPNDPLIGRVLDGRYEMMQRIGEGGMGVVYKARQVSIDRVIAIKMLNQEMAKDPNWVKRFNNEAKACSRLQHPNTIRLFDFGQTREGSLFMAMEFLDGQSLREAIASGAPMAGVRVLKILIQACASLTEAHSFGIIHRDIKPDNVFLLNLAGSPDFVKLLDFSVAKLLQENDAMRTQAGVVFGTPQYMSPEQGRGVPLDARSDIYALGILAYEMLTGRVPFTDQNAMNVLQMHIRQRVPPLPQNIPDSVRGVVMRCLEKDTGRRFQSANEMMHYCQQVFAEIGARAAAINSRGHAPQAGPPAPHAPPPQAAHATSPASAPADQKTMLAGEAPDVQALLAQARAGNLPNPDGPLGGSGGPPASMKTMIADGGGTPAQAFGPPPAAMKTMIADGGAPSSPSPGGFSGGAPAMPGGEGAAPKKTMMLQQSEGVVSIAASINAAAASTPQQPVFAETENTSVTSVDGGASAMFWVICLATGLGIGVLAYLAVLAIG